MRIEKPQNISENEQGSALVYTLMVLLLLSLLGMSVGMVTVGSYKLSDSNRDYTSAYYIAEAGARIAFDDIQEIVEVNYSNKATKESIRKKIANYTLPRQPSYTKQYGKTPTNSIDVIEVNGAELEFNIVSIGKIGNVERTVEKKFNINWLDDSGQNFPDIPVGASLLALGKVNLSGSKITGNMLLNTSVPGSLEIGWGSFWNSVLHHSPMITPKLLSKKEDAIGRIPKTKKMERPLDYSAYTNYISNFSAPVITQRLAVDWAKKGNNKYKVIDESGNVSIKGDITEDYVLELEKDVYIPDFTSNYPPFSIDTNGKNITLIIDNLDLDSNEVKIIGGGAVTLIVRDSIDLVSMGPFNSSGSPNQLKIVYLGEEEFRFNAWNTLNAHLIIKKADFISNSKKINGIILTGGDNVTLSNGGGGKILLIAPDAEVTMNGGYSMFGTVIASSFDMSDGSTLVYADTSDYKFGVENNEPTNPKDLIEEKPIIEPN